LLACYRGLVDTARPVQISLNLWAVVCKDSGGECPEGLEPLSNSDPLLAIPEFV